MASNVNDEIPGGGLAALNVVQLRGRVSGAAEARVLPSGTELVTFRVVVDRLRPADPHSKITVDVIDCVAWQPRLRHQVAGWRSGDVVEVDGALRRRFYRGGGGTSSRTEVEMVRGRVVRRAGSGASSGAESGAGTGGGPPG
jgi:single-strand DNA-binding protein